MRQRKKKNLDRRLEQAVQVRELQPEHQRGQWRRRFDAAPDAPLVVELGCGKGAFACELAQRHPEYLIIAFDKVPEVLVMAMERAAELELKNLLFVLDDALLMDSFFEPGELSRIHINFCDPWHKKRQAKRRLVHRDFLARYMQLLSIGGQIHFKTDNRPLFDFALEEFEVCGFDLSEICYDLHAIDAPWNIVTEYERTWSEKGYPINRLVATVTERTKPAPPRTKEEREGSTEE